MNAKEIATKARDAIHGLIGISGTPEEMRAGEIAAAESIIAEALAEKGKEIARMREALDRARDAFQDARCRICEELFSEEPCGFSEHENAKIAWQMVIAALLPPDEKKEEPDAH